MHPGHMCCNVLTRPGKTTGPTRHLLLEVVSSLGRLGNGCRCAQGARHTVLFQRCETEPSEPGNFRDLATPPRPMGAFDRDPQKTPSHLSRIERHPKRDDPAVPVLVGGQPPVCVFASWHHPFFFSLSRRRCEFATTPPPPPQSALFALHLATFSPLPWPATPDLLPLPLPPPPLRSPPLIAGDDLALGCDRRHLQHVAHMG